MQQIVIVRTAMMTSSNSSSRRRSGCAAAELFTTLRAPQGAPSSPVAMHSILGSNYAPLAPSLVARRLPNNFAPSLHCGVFCKASSLDLSIGFTESKQRRNLLLYIYTICNYRCVRDYLAGTMIC